MHPFAEYELDEPWVPRRFQWQPGVLIAGVDEVGRGPLVGAVVTAAVILDPNKPIEGLNDSKKLTEKKRQALAVEIKQKALAYSYGRAEPGEIDELNILHATMLAMQRAVKALPQQPYAIGVNGHRRLPSISSALILATVALHAEVLAMHHLYPEYDFDRH